MAVQIGFICAHCGGYSNATPILLDNDVTFHCGCCNKHSVLRLLKPEELAAHDAAPDLLAAFEKMVDEMNYADRERFATGQEMRETAEAAIAKAKQPKGGE